MQNSAAFFGGLLLGGVLAAACGFDFFSSSQAVRMALRETRARVSELEMKLDAAKADHGRLLVRHQGELRKVKRLEMSLAKARGATFAQLARSSADADTAAPRRAVAKNVGDASSLRGALPPRPSPHPRRQLLEDALEFFSRPRSIAYRDLARDFLGSADTTDWMVYYKCQLILNLRRHSPELLLALNCPPRGSRTLEGFFRLPPAALPAAGELLMGPRLAHETP